MDGLRGVAILWVMLHHANYFLGWGERLGPVLRRFFHVGFLGVDIFFVTSGFLITGLLIGDLGGHIRLRRFYLRRFFKIAPQYLLAVVTGFILIAAAQENYGLKQKLSYFFFLQNYVDPILLMHHLWSIAIEEHFYLFYPLVLASACFLFPRIEQRRTYLLMVFVCLIGLGNYARYLWFLNRPESDLLYAKIWQVTHIRFDALIFGCLIKLLEPSLVSRTRSMKKIFASMCFFLAVGVFLWLIPRYQPLGWHCYTMAYVGAGLVLLSALTDFTPLKIFLEQPILRSIGRDSYGIYLWHYLLLFPFKAVWLQTGRNHAFILFYFLISVYAGALTTRTVEKYFLNMRSRIVP